MFNSFVIRSVKFELSVSKSPFFLFYLAYFCFIILLCLMKRLLFFQLGIHVYLLLGVVSISTSKTKYCCNCTGHKLQNMAECINNHIWDANIKMHTIVLWLILNEKVWKWYSILLLRFNFLFSMLLNSYQTISKFAFNRKLSASIGSMQLLITRRTAWFDWGDFCSLETSYFKWW